MSKKPLLPLLSLLVLIPTLTIFLTFHFSTSGAETDPLQEEGFSLLDPLSPGYSGSPVASEASGSVELELVGRWPYGPALAVTSGEIGGTSYAFLGSGGVVLVLDMTDLTGLTRVGSRPVKWCKPESTEGGRLVSILKWPEGAPLNLG